MHPHTIKMLAFKLNTDDYTGRSPPLWPVRHGVRDFQQECQIWTLLTIERLSTFKTVHFKWALAHRTRWRSRTMFTYGFLLHDIVFTDSGFWKYSWAHLVMSMTEWVMLWWADEWCSVVWGSNKGLRPCPLRTERFLQFLWIFWWCYALSMMRFVKPLQFDVEERCF